MPETSDSKPQFSEASYGGLQAKFEQGLALHQQGKLADAERIYREIFQQQPKHFRALHLLGAIALQNGQTDRALELLGKAIALKPDYAEAHYNRGLALMHLKRPLEALASYDQAIALNPNYAEAHNNGGVALRDLNRPDDALKSFEMAITLKPDYAEAHYNRGLVLLDLKRPGDALASYNQAIALNPNYVEAYNNRGITLYDLNRFADALASVDQAIVLNPDSAMAHNNRARVLAKLNRYNEAFAAYDRAFVLDPDMIGVEGDRLSAKMQICDWRNHDSECTHLISSVRHGKVNPPFHFLAISSSSDDQLQCAKLLIANKFPPSRKPIWHGERYHHKRIRVAYLSPDFREHAMPYLVAGMFECHDKSLFDITAISCGPDDNSEIRKRVTNSFERFIGAEKYSDERIANLVKELEIDIFVDLAGYTTGSRLGVFAKRPAPIQVNYLGYPGTMGAQYIDYIIADRIIVPEGQQKFYSEKIIVLPNSYQVTDNKRPIADRAFSRAELGLPSTGFVFSYR